MIYELFERDTLMDLNPDILKTTHNNMRDIINSLIVNYITDDLCSNNDVVEKYKYTTYYKNDKMKYMLILTMIYARNYKFYENDIYVDKEDDKIIIDINKIYKWKRQLDRKVVYEMKELCKKGYCYCKGTKKNYDNETYFNDYSWIIAAYENSNRFISKRILGEHILKSIDKCCNLDLLFDIKKYYRKDICPFAHKFILDKKFMTRKYNNIKKIIEMIPLEPDKALTFVLSLFNKILMHDNFAKINSFDIENMIYSIMIYTHHIFKFNFMKGNPPANSSELLNYIFIINNSISEHLLQQCEKKCICDYTEDIKEKIRKQNAFKSYVLRENKIDFS